MRGLSPWHRLMGTSHGSWSGLQRQVSISWVSHTCMQQFNAKLTEQLLQLLLCLPINSLALEVGSRMDGTVAFFCCDGC